MRRSGRGASQAGRRRGAQVTGRRAGARRKTALRTRPTLAGWRIIVGCRPYTTEQGKPRPRTIRLKADGREGAWGTTRRNAPRQDTTSTRPWMTKPGRVPPGAQSWRPPRHGYGSWTEFAPCAGPLHRWAALRRRGRESRTSTGDRNANHMRALNSGMRADLARIVSDRVRSSPVARRTRRPGEAAPGATAG